MSLPLVRLFIASTPEPRSDQTIKAFHSTLNGLRGLFFLIISELLGVLWNTVLKFIKSLFPA